MGLVKSVDGRSLSREVVSQGDNVLLQQGDLIIGGLELPLSKEEVGPHLHSDLVRGFEDIDDFPPIVGQAVGVGGEGQSYPCLKSGTWDCGYRRGGLGVHGGVLGIHDSRTSWRGSIQRSVTGQARECSWRLSYT